MLEIIKDHFGKYWREYLCVGVFIVIMMLICSVVFWGVSATKQTENHYVETIKSRKKIVVLDSMLVEEIQRRDSQIMELEREIKSVRKLLETSQTDTIIIKKGL